MNSNQIEQMTSHQICEAITQAKLELDEVQSLLIAGYATLEFSEAAELAGLESDEKILKAEIDLMNQVLAERVGHQVSTSYGVAA